MLVTTVLDYRKNALQVSLSDKEDVWIDEERPQKLLDEICHLLICKWKLDLIIERQESLFP